MRASIDSSVLEWCLQSGTCVKVAVVYPAVVDAIGSMPGGERAEAGGGVLHIWEGLEAGGSCLNALVEEQRLKQPAGQSVRSLLAMEGVCGAA